MPLTKAIGRKNTAKIKNLNRNRKVQKPGDSSSWT